jgi:hypothetical protein
MKSKNALWYDGNQYYPVSYNHIYWLDDGDKEFKEKLFGFLSFRITGPFRVDIFKRAVASLIRRHEDLHLTFHEIAGKYFIRLEDPNLPQFEIDFRDLRNTPHSKEEESDHLLHFPGHQFELSKGPLFLVRLLHTKDDEFILSMKLHHAICDGWSLEILKRDLYTAYCAILDGKEPELPCLDRQLKDFMADAMEFVDTNFESDNQFWNELYPDPPGTLVIPGIRARDGDIAIRAGKEIWIPLPVGMKDQLKELGGRYSTSIFVILQSLLKMYLARVSGQGDLVLGVFGFGRAEFPGSEDQIGLFSRMLFVRTILEGNDSLAVVIRKVKTSNDDMRKHKACSLLDSMAQKMPPKPDMLDSFWKISMDFSDGAGYQPGSSGVVVNDSPEDVRFQAITRGQIEVVQTQTELTLNFYLIENGAYVDVRYDSGLCDKKAIEELFSDFFTFAQENITVAMS